MLTNLQLTNFMRHQSLDLTFDAGFSCLRGVNEAGKSSVVTAFSYALFGALALRTSVDETCTWGFPPSSMKVKATVQVRRYSDATLALFHGPRCIGRYQADGTPVDITKLAA